MTSENVTSGKMQYRVIGEVPCVEGTRSTRDPEGRAVISHAVEVPYEAAACLWDQRNTELEGIRNDYQIAILPPNNDATEAVLTSNAPVLSHSYPVVTFDREVFPELEDRLYLQNEAPRAQHLYIIASAVRKSDILDIQRVAWHYKNVLNVKHVTAFLTFFRATRQDKNVDKNGQYVPSPVNIAADIEAMPRVDSFFVLETHSAATQSAAATVDKPLCPITPWRYVMDRALSKPVSIDDEMVTITPENGLFIRPDKGRNMAATRGATHYGFKSVSFDKKRVDAKHTIPFLENPADRAMVAGRVCVCYDDELATNGTIRQIAEKLQEYGARGLVIMGVHGKFTADWEENISHPLIKKIYVTDSRIPVGNIQPYLQSGKIEVIPLKDLVLDIIAADIRGVNFWRDQEYRHMILQDPEDK